MKFKPFLVAFSTPGHIMKGPVIERMHTSKNFSKSEKMTSTN